MKSTARIKSGYCKLGYTAGSGDTGKSNLIIASKCNKASPTSHFYNIAWEFMRDIDGFLTSSTYIPLETHELGSLEWLRRNLLSLSSFAFLQGRSKDHCLPEEFLTYMDKYIRDYSLLVGPAPDFIIWDTQIGVLIETLIISSRKLEVAFQELNLELNPEVELTYSILNRLSTWLFWLGRDIYRRSNIGEVYWQAKIETFPY